MSIVVKTLNSFELREFALDRLYSPSEQAQVKAGNSAYYAEVNRVRKAKEVAEQEAKKPRVLSPEELYQVRLAEDNQRKAEQKARAAAQEEREEQHRKYLASTPERVTICTTSFYIFCLEFAIWNSKGYILEIESLEANPPSLFVAYLNRATPAKTSKQ
jgi:hypothetical protein